MAGRRRDMEEDSEWRREDPGLQPDGSLGLRKRPDPRYRERIAYGDTDRYGRPNDFGVAPRPVEPQEPGDVAGAEPAVPDEPTAEGWGFGSGRTPRRR